MSRVSGIAAAALVLLPSALGVSVGGDSACTVKALEYLACWSPLSPVCIEAVSEQATAFCSSYLSLEPVTVFTTTATPIATVTVTATETSETTATDLPPIPPISLPTTFVAASTSTITSYDPNFSTVSLLSAKRRGVPGVTGCPDLTRKPLTRHPAAKLSSVCSCLGVTATTVFTGTIAAESTATASATDTVTVTVTETSVTTEIETATESETSTTTVSTVVATETAIVDVCGIGYNPSGNGVGNTIINAPAAASARECCQLCWNTPNCVAAAPTTACQLLIKIQPLEGAPTSLTCPFGKENYDFLPGPGVVYKGPCGIP